MKPRIAFLGLGVMGSPMAGHLSNNGFEVTVYNRTRVKADAWLKKYVGKIAESASNAAIGADFVMMCVGNDDDVIAVGTEALSTMKPGAILVDHTTASADVARKMYALCQTKGVHFLDAPVSGGQAGAENGKLTVMVGGDEEAFNLAKPIIDNYARATTLMGPSGAGQLTKMVNQICIAGLLQGLSEGLAFAEKAGLDAQLVLDVISKGAAQSWQMENRGSTMLQRQFNFGFAVDWMKKDLDICLAEAARNGAKLPMAQQVETFYAELQKMGEGRSDTSSLIKLL